MAIWSKKKKNGPGRRKRLLRGEVLERRELKSVDVVGGIPGMGDVQLQILGTDGPDEVMIVWNPWEHGVTVLENGVTHRVYEDFDYVYFEGRGGDDVFVNNSSIIPSLAMGGPGDDRLIGGEWVDIMAGDDGNDVINGRGGTNMLFGDAGQGDLYFPADYEWGAAPGNDTIFGGDDFDWIVAGEGDDLVDAGAGWDYVFGGAGNDLLRAGTGDDVLMGEDGNDILLGEEGTDCLIGGPGYDLLIGGLGKDTLVGTHSLRGYFSPGRSPSPSDILIGGTTDHDDNDKALMAIMDEWTRPASRAERTRNLRTGVGPGRAFALNTHTVHGEGAADSVLSDDEDDWILPEFLW